MKINEICGEVLVGKNGSFERDLVGTLENVKHSLKSFHPETLDNELVIWAFDYKDGDLWFTGYRILVGGDRLLETSYCKSWEAYVGMRQGNYPND